MITEALCYSLAVSFLKPPLKRFGFRTAAITRFDDMHTYLQERVDTVSEYANLFQRFTKFRGKTVMELGCNRGYLLNTFLQSESFTAIGADLSAEALEIGRLAYQDRIRFVQSTPNTVPLPTASVDIVYSIDTVEHLSQPQVMFREIHRILKPGGLFLVHFNPWLNPYGSHLEDIIPFPWPHAIFSMRTLLNAAERLYESPYYKTACYFIDECSGLKKPNPYRDKSKWDTYLNHMTIRRFNRMLHLLPFQLQHQERSGFGGKTFKVGRFVRYLANVPVLDEFFTNALFTVLRKEDQPA
jgi:SAM-dependent methyltransferase